MKQYSIQIQFIALFTALYFMLAGIGHNVVDYCCDSCETVGIEFLSHHTCSDVHHSDVLTNHDHAHEVNCCASTQEPENGFNECPIDGKCELTRFQLDNYYSFSSSIHLQIPVIELENTLSPFTSFVLRGCQYSNNLTYPPPESKLYVGRSILTQKSVLII